MKKWNIESFFPHIYVKRFDNNIRNTILLLSGASSGIPTTNNIGNIMSHEIYQERMVANDGQAVWHGLGKVRTLVQSFTEAISEILQGATYSIEPAATYARGRFDLLPQQFHVIFRDPQNEQTPIRSYGVVSKDFQIVTPDRIADLLNPVLSDNGYEVATAGLLRNGSSIFVAMKGGDRQIVGEQYQDYLTFDLSFEPGRTMKVYSTPVRTVCANTQSLGIDASSVNMEISHTGNVHGKMEIATEFVRSVDERKEYFAALMEAFAKYQMNRDELTAMVDAAHPIPRRPKALTGILDKMSPAEIVRFAEHSSAMGDLIEDLSSKERAYVNSIARAEEGRKLVRSAMDNFNAEFPEFRGTAYAAYNAATQTADWRAGKGNPAESAIAGARFREKVRAAGFLSSLVSV